MGAGALHKHKYQEPYHVEGDVDGSSQRKAKPSKTPHNSRHAQSNTLEPFHVKVAPKHSLCDINSSSKLVEAGSKLVTPPFTTKASPRPGLRKSSLTKADLQQIKAQRARVMQTLQVEGFVPGADVNTPKGPKLLSRSRTKEEIEEAFPSLIDADAAAIAKVQELQDTLLRTQHEDITERRRIFRTLCYQWHASRHDGTASERWADRVYQHLMQQRDWYLAAGAPADPLDHHYNEAMRSW